MVSKVGRRLGKVSAEGESVAAEHEREKALVVEV